MKLKFSIFVDDIYHVTRIVVTPCVIGRSKKSGLTVSHQAVSRKHCELFEQDNTLYLRDHNSLNGTYYNGEMIDHDVALSNVDEFSIGEVHFRTEIITTNEQLDTTQVELDKETQQSENSAHTLVELPELSSVTMMEH
ncbi:MAG: FHA domain-containing protein [Planctomycetaceae bacterium]|nr:FHA domain-containing protein [Planctomycetaceae bacterium]